MPPTVTRAKGQPARPTPRLSSVPFARALAPKGERWASGATIKLRAVACPPRGRQPTAQPQGPVGHALLASSSAWGGGRSGGVPSEKLPSGEVGGILAGGPSTVGPSHTLLATSPPPPAHFGLAGRTPVRGTQLGPGPGSAVLADPHEGFWGTSFKSFGKTLLLSLQRGLCHSPPLPPQAKKGPGVPWASLLPVSPQGHVPQDRPPGEGGCGCRTQGRLGSGVNVTLCPLSLCVCLHSAPHGLIPLSPERWAASPPSVHVACGGCSCHQGLPEVKIKGPCPRPCSEVLCVLNSKEMPELNLKIV